MSYNKKLKDLLNDNTKSRKGLWCKNGTELNSILLEETSFLVGNHSNTQRLLYVKFNIFEQVKCPHCNKLSSIDTRCETFKIKFCNNSCHGKYLNKDTGLTNGQIQRNNQSITMDKIDPETGLTGYQKSAIKHSITLNKIQKSGLTKAEQIGLKVKETMAKIDPVTGLTGYQKSAIKHSITLNKTQKSGLTKAEQIGLKVKETMAKIDPETGLTGHQKACLKAKETLSQIDPETGLTGYQQSGINSKKVLSQIDPETGLTGYQKAGLKSKEILSQIDPETRLTGYQKACLKTKETLSQIDPETGLTGYQKFAIKTKKTKSQVDYKTGLNGYQKASLKGKEIIKIDTYNKRLNNFPKEYTLITTKSDYIKSSNSIFKYSCNKCGSIRKSYWPYIRCTKCHPYNKSIGENKVLEFCESLGTIPESNSRQIITPLELDIYLPDHNLAIEYNGLFYHSSYSLDSENQDYHLNKTQECEKLGIQLFHIFENEWLDPVKQEIWKSIIKNRLGKSERIFARKTEIRSVTSKDKIEFLNSNHLQGNCNSLVNIGLYLGDELISLMTFSRSRYDKKIDWELLRFCNKIGYSVVGGASRLLKAFRKENHGSIISYADKRRSSGNLYKKLGFEFSHDSEPNYWYYRDPMILESRIGYQKHKLKDRLDVFDDKKTESENMYENGYRKIYDCGNHVYKLK